MLLLFRTNHPMSLKSKTRPTSVKTVPTHPPTGTLATQRAHSAQAARRASALAATRDHPHAPQGGEGGKDRSIDTHEDPMCPNCEQPREVYKDSRLCEPCYKLRGPKRYGPGDTCPSCKDSGLPLSCCTFCKKLVCERTCFFTKMRACLDCHDKNLEPQCWCQDATCPVDKRGDQACTQPGCECGLDPDLVLCDICRNETHEYEDSDSERCFVCVKCYNCEEELTRAELDSPSCVCEKCEKSRS